MSNNPNSVKHQHCRARWQGLNNSPANALYFLMGNKQNIHQQIADYSG